MATLRITCFALLAISALAGSAFAQDGTKPSDLTPAPSNSVPATSGASAAPASAVPASTTTAPAPGVNAGTTSGAAIGGMAANNPNDATDTCDSTTYNKPQVHGSVGAGVVASNHFSGAFQTASVDIAKPLGDCDHPRGGLSISVSGSQGQFSTPGWHH